MRYLFRRHWKLRDFVLLSWLVPGFLAVCASLLVFFFLGWLDYQNSKQRLVDDLSQKAVIAARRLSAEIILGSKGAVEPVRELLTKEFSIDDIAIANISPPCGSGDIDGFCVKGDQIHFFRLIPHTAQPAFVVLSQSFAPLTSFLNLYLLLWSAVPVFLTLAVGLFLQRLLIRSFVIDPINSLVATSERQMPLPAHWPSEIKNIATQLASSFEAREQAVFAMLARGVVHDIRTFLHSLLTATELVREQEKSAEKRALRMENLYRACTTNLPKMRRIIDLTLDGSREIPIRPIEKNVIETIKGAIDANGSYASARRVTVELRSDRSAISVPHDPVQLERALANLIRNGIEAISTQADDAYDRRVWISVNSGKMGDLALDVEDDGPGIGAKEAEDLFKPIKSAKAHGAGLGLYVTEKIVRGHHGFIRAGQSDHLKGARFTISLPATLKAEGGVI